MSEATFFNQILIWPFINILVGLYKIFDIAQIPGAFGWAIISLTILIRGAMNPLTQKQMDSARKLQELKPHIDALKKKHKDDQKKFQEEQLKLYQQHGINPAAGCLPMLISFPILIALYQVFFQVLSNGNLTEMVTNINKIVYFPFLRIESLDLTFFGLNLAVKPNQWQEVSVLLLAVPVITGFLQWYQMKKTTPISAPAPIVAKKGEEKEKAPQDMAADMQKQMMLIFPFMIGFAAYSFPIGLALYWNTFSLMSLWGLSKKTKKVAK